MIDRSYLPYQSARDFQDRGMAKWAGFFLSEHSTALQTNHLSLEELRLLSNEEIRRLLEQAYQQKDSPLPLYPPGQSSRRLLRPGLYLKPFRSPHQKWPALPLSPSFDYFFY